ncbi:right-handed parallel beta-helix repeat-containing protein [Roseisolibacter sp. H3M3-2]|uniref:right-handed parallel beta-helix repeat-containing protein n=1 Tax=Roseisolibacter sp. H3M3-2 TaxID=3031323 RepID=UPI0023DBFABD|nr:right-handed parallel beta-helix repeat-containing protein [Roseisolibacter sp. H3M3-2]MDF1503274.1 right-handed parallel beta-helix repeat-containing protein [Roseisolibacter sp. H3M3-2]
MRSYTLCLALAALAACAEDSTQPAAPPAAPRRQTAAGDVLTVTSLSGGTEPGTLRWAVDQAAGGETIRFARELAGGTIVLDSTLNIDEQLVIEGPADRGVTVSGGGVRRVVTLGAPGWQSLPPIVLRNLTVTGGFLPAGGAGAGILSFTPLVLEHVTVTGNVADGAAAILHGRIRFPETDDPYPSLTLVNSTVSGNAGRGTTLATVHSDGDLALVNSTVADNANGGFYVTSRGVATIRNTIVARNGTAANCQVLPANLRAEGRNVADDASCGDAAATLVADPLLEPLADNGGPSWTRAPHPSSPAIDAGVACTVAVDQRYAARGTPCDVGAVEGAVPTAVAITIDGAPTLDAATGHPRVAGTVRCSRAGDQFALDVRLQQQKSDNAPGTTRGAAEVAVACTTTARAWSALVAPASGAFRPGAAAADVGTRQTAAWVTPAVASRTVTIARPKK